MLVFIVGLLWLICNIQLALLGIQASKVWLKFHVIKGKKTLFDKSRFAIIEKKVFHRT